MIIEIESHSGFCTGVKRVVKLAEAELKEGKKLHCLGEIVHNQVEVERLMQSGLSIVNSGVDEKLKNADILIRAHGEPISTYERLAEGNNRVIDGTCPVVVQVQEKIKKSYQEARNDNGQIVIYGKYNHPEVIGLLGQINNDAITVVNEEDVSTIDFTRPVYLFSQTTMPLDGYSKIQQYIQSRMSLHFTSGEEPLHVFDTICRQVANRIPQLTAFARKFEVIIFVGGAKSSNGKVLYQACLNENSQSYFISEASSLQKEWFEKAESVGICGATSTPLWQMEQVKSEIIHLVVKNK